MRVVERHAALLDGRGGAEIIGGGSDAEHSRLTDQRDDRDGQPYGNPGPAAVSHCESEYNAAYKCQEALPRRSRGSRAPAGMHAERSIHAKKPATKRYPFSFGRVEDLAGLAVVLTIFGSAALLSIRRSTVCLHPEAATYPTFAL